VDLQNQCKTLQSLFDDANTNLTNRKNDYLKLKAALEKAETDYTTCWTNCNASGSSRYTDCGCTVAKENAIRTARNMFGYWDCKDVTCKQNLPPPQTEIDACKAACPKDAGPYPAGYCEAMCEYPSVPRTASQITACQTQCAVTNPGTLEQAQAAQDRAQAQYKAAEAELKAYKLAYT